MHHQIHRPLRFQCLLGSQDFDVERCEEVGVIREEWQIMSFRGRRYPEILRRTC